MDTNIRDDHSLEPVHDARLSQPQLATLDLLSGGKLNFHINDTNNFVEFLAQAPFSPVFGQWYHLAVRRSGSTFSEAASPVGEAAKPP